MKDLNLFILPIILLIFMFAAANSHAQIRGDGNIVKENRFPGSFSEIETDGVINVYLSQGNSESIVVETDRNLQALVITTVKNNLLSIRNKSNADITKSTKMNVYVTLKDIERLEINGVGKLETQNKLHLSSLKIDNNGVGNIVLDLQCNSLKVEENSVGNLTLTGEIRDVKIEHNGVGNIQAEDLKADILKIESNGVGSAEVYSSKEIYINLNGVGNVSYKGNAMVKEMNVNGTGKVTKN